MAPPCCVHMAAHTAVCMGGTCRSNPKSFRSAPPEYTTAPPPAAPTRRPVSTGFDTGRQLRAACCCGAQTEQRRGVVTCGAAIADSAYTGSVL